MKLNNKTLEGWLEKPPMKCFKHSKRIDYSSRYKALRDYLDKNVHKHVVIGANLKDPDILLNDHGTDHINTVIERASELVACSSCNLNALEVYVLLVCIQLHDVGNIFGRYNHELNNDKIYEEVEKIIGLDVTEVKFLYELASTHGGRTNTGDKDKIVKLREVEPLKDNDVRARLIAAILRFADELADDKTRTNIRLIEDPKFPRKSEVFHVYASCLDNVKVKLEDKAVELHFKIPVFFAEKRFGKMDEEILLLNEIYNRVMKMHFERIYFMRFASRVIEIETILVFIDFYDKYLTAYEPITFSISETGYPDENGKTIFDICPELVDDDGVNRDGDYIINKYIKEDGD